MGQKHCLLVTAGSHIDLTPWTECVNNTVNSMVDPWLLSNITDRDDGIFWTEDWLCVMISLL